MFYSTTGLVGDTAFHTRIAECLIKHPEYFFGEAPVIESPPKPVRNKHPASLNLEDIDINDEEDIDFEALHRPLSINSEDSINGECVMGEHTMCDSECTVRAYSV